MQGLFKEFAAKTAASVVKGAASFTPVLQSGSAQQAQAAGGAGNSQQGAAESKRQYLRLPLESARKLRWYENADLEAIVRSHMREKREVYTAVTLLKKLLLRKGCTEAEIDAETQQAMNQSDELCEADCGVWETLVTSLQAEVESLREQLENSQQQQLQVQAAAGLGAMQAGGGASGLSAAALSGLHAELVQELTDTAEELDRRMAAAWQLSKAVSAAESDVSVAEAGQALRAIALRQQQQQQQQQEGNAGPVPVQEERARTSGTDNGHGPSTDGWDASSPTAAIADAGLTGGAGEPSQGGMSMMPLVARLQRLELERREMLDEMAQLREAAAGAASQASSRGKAEERVASLTASLEQSTSELSTCRAQLRAAEEAAERLGAELKRAQAGMQSADVMRRYQEHCLEAEERARAAERHAARFDARAAKAESELRETTAQLKSKEQAVQALEKQVSAMQQRLASAEAAAATATQQAAGKLASSAAQSEELSSALEQVRILEAQCSSLQRELHSAQAALQAAEHRASSAENREAVLAQELEGVAAERDELSTQVQTLRDVMSDQRMEKSLAEHYKQVAAGLEESRQVVEEELVVTAQLVTQMEVRLRDALDRANAAETATTMAENRARSAEAAVAKEVELRMTAASSNKALWPNPIKDEFSRLEQRLAALQTSLSAAESQLAAEGRALQHEQQARADLSRRVRDADERALRSEREAMARMRELQQRIEAGTVEAAELRSTLARVEAERDAALSSLTSHPRHGMQRATSGGMQSSSSLDTPHKWQVQNTVGGGGLRGIQDKAPPASPARPAGNGSALNGRSSGSHMPGMPGPPASVDLTYVKNVVLKFLEASAAGKTQERDALLPAVAAVLHATPSEFKVLRQLTGTEKWWW